MNSINLNLKNAVESTRSTYCTDSLRNFDDFLLHRMGDTPSAKNRQNFSKNQYINHSRNDSIAFFRLNELTLDNLGQWPLAVKVGVLIGVSFLIISLGYWLIIADNFSQFDILKNQEVTLKTEFEGKQRQLYNLSVYRQQLNILQDRFATELKQLPVQNEMSDLLEVISKTGVTSGLKFELFAPQPEVMHDFYVELPIKISVVGTYFQLAMFISRVVQMNRIVTLHDFSIAGVASKENKVVLQDVLVMNMTAKIYRYRAS